MSGKIQKLLEFNTGYSDFQIDYYISAKSGKTEYGTFKQACLEIQTRYYGLFDQHCELEKSRKELEECKDEIEKMQLRMKISSKEKQIKQAESQMKRFYQLATYLDGEDHRFSTMSHEAREEEEYKMWIAKLSEAVACDMITTGRVTPSNALHIRNCPPKIKDAIMPRLATPEGRAQLMQEFVEGSNYQLPAELPEVELQETKLLDFIKELDDGR